MTERPFTTYTKKVCGKCGKDDVMVDAWAEWDFEAQEFRLRDTFEHSYCNHCEGETTIEDIEMSGAEAMKEMSGE